MKIGRDSEVAKILSDLIKEWHLRGNWPHQWVALRNAVELLAHVGQTTAAETLLRAIERSPSSGEVFGAQADRLTALDATFPSSETFDPLSDDQVIDVARAGSPWSLESRYLRSGSRNAGTVRAA